MSETKGDSVWQGEPSITVDADICKKAIEAFGTQYMLNVAMEEPAELIQAISKMRRQPTTPDITYARTHLIEEMADCYIVLEELAQMYEVDRNEVNNIISFKQARTLKRIGSYKTAGIFDKAKAGNDKKTTLSSFFDGFDRAIIEDSTGKPLVTFAEGEVDCSDGYRVRMRPIYDEESNDEEHSAG